MGIPGGTELLVIALVVVLLFGGKKIPELAKGIGSGIRNFKKAVKEDEEPEVAKSEKIEDTSSEAKVEKTTAKKSTSKKSKTQA